MGRIVIVGGTGTLGTALIERLHGKHDVVCLSRGELAQKQTAARFPGVKMMLGDVRDRQSLRPAIVGADVVFLLAAIKHVDLAEQNPLEAVKTNILGAVNVAEIALEADVKHVVYSNTDKAVLPITTYGYTKAIAQNYLLSLNHADETRFSVFNWGNIIASRGSVVQTFVDKLQSGHVIPITHPEMNRFWLNIDTAADFMLKNYPKAPTDRAMIPPVKGASVVRLVAAIAKILDVEKYTLVNMGLRGTEKIYEVLESRHDGCLRSDTCPQYSDRELDALLRPTILRLKDDSKTADRRIQGVNGPALHRDPSEDGHSAASGGRR